MFFPRRIGVFQSVLIASPIPVDLLRDRELAWEFQFKACAQRVIGQGACGTPVPATERVYPVEPPKEKCGGLGVRSVGTTIRRRTHVSDEALDVPRFRRPVQGTPDDYRPFPETAGAFIDVLDRETVKS
jgi:hypothetical protein